MSHHAVNVRTYVRPERGGPAGIYFFTLDCSALLPTLGAFALFNLPYRYSRMKREQKGARFTLRSKRVASTVAIAAEWEAEDELLATRPLGRRGARPLFRGAIHPVPPPAGTAAPPLPAVG